MGQWGAPAQADDRPGGHRGLTPGATGSSSPATTTKRVVVGLGLLVISGLGPWAFLMLLGWPNVANAAVVPGMALTILCITGTGWRAGILIVGPFAVLSGLAVWALPSPWLAAIVLAVAAFVRGYAAREGLHDALILTVIAMGFLVTTPPQFTTTVPAGKSGMVDCTNTINAADPACTNQTQQQ